MDYSPNCNICLCSAPFDRIGDIGFSINANEDNVSEAFVLIVCFSSQELDLTL